MIIGVLGAITLIGLIWLALGFLSIAMFLGLATLVGMAWSALITGVVFLVVIIVAALIASRKIEQAKRKAMLSGFATSALTRLALGLVMGRPLLSLGLGGAAAAAFFATRKRPAK